VLTVAIQASSFVTDWNDNYFTNYLEEKLGCELEFILLSETADEARTKLSLMATDGGDVADLFISTTAFTAETIYQYGSDGFFVDLTDYLNDPAVMPNYNMIPDDVRARMNMAQTQADGRMYTTTNWTENPWNVTPYRLFINKDWVEAVGKEIPTTTEELKEVLIAFRDQDPNGNGKKDEIGIWGWTGGGYGQNTIAALMNSFVSWNANVKNGGLALNEDGTQVIAPFATEEWKAGLAYLKDLYNEGLIDPAVFTNDEASFKAAINMETPVVGMYSAGSLSVWANAGQEPNFAQYDFIAPVAGPEGIGYTPYNDYEPEQRIAVLGGTDQLELALKFVDQFYDLETSMCAEMGEKDVDYSLDPAFCADYTNAYKEMGIVDSMKLVEINDMWATPNNKAWRINIGYRPEEYVYGRAKSWDQAGGVTATIRSENLINNFDKHPEHLLSTLKYNTEEMDACLDPMANIPEYVTQSMAQFITGAGGMDLETGWDAYLATLETMGLSAWLEASQSAYERVAK